ncbi:MAG: DUF1440 domain-containing protein [Phycisphaeraceae bacterium]
MRQCMTMMRRSKGDSGWARKSSSADMAKGMLAGVVGGIAGAWAMNQFHLLTTKVTGHGGDEAQQAAEHEPGDAQAAQRGKEKKGEPTTVLAADAVSRRLFHHELSEKEQQMAGPAMHYGFGAVMGGIYGTAAETIPMIRVGEGAAYGAAVWLVADEAAVPALGLAGPPTQHPPSVHLSSLGAHLVYGLVTESVRRTVMALW